MIMNGSRSLMYYVGIILFESNPNKSYQIKYFLNHVQWSQEKKERFSLVYPSNRLRLSTSFWWLCVMLKLKHDFTSRDHCVRLICVPSSFYVSPSRTISVNDYVKGL